MCRPARHRPAVVRRKLLRNWTLVNAQDERRPRVMVLSRPVETRYHLRPSGSPLDGSLPRSIVIEWCAEETAVETRGRWSLSSPMRLQP